MKKMTFFFAVLITSLCLNAQISLNFRRNVPASGAYPSAPVLNKLGISGYKYVWFNNSTKTIEIYNTNQSLFKSIAVPTASTSITTAGSVYYISETLFNSDNLIEYAYVGYTGSGPNITAKFYIFNENGSQLFFRDSAQFSFSTTSNLSVANTEPVFYDGTKTVMRLNIGSNAVAYEYYDLPGTLPCIQCSGSGPTSARAESQSNNSEPVFYPNPANGQLKLKYELPAGYKTACIKVQDLQGKEIETFRVTNAFDAIYLPENYNSGLYIYSLIIDDKVVKREKIILTR